MSAYQVRLADRTLRIQVRRAGDQMFVRVDDGDERPVQLRALRGVLKSLVLDTRRLELLAARAGPDTVDLVLDGLDFQAEVLDETHARLAQVAGARGASHARRELKAPMPGLVVRVLVAVGDTVEAGQPLVVLQAMKMENELSLPRGGSVSSVSAAAGQTVEAGQVLAVVE